MKIIEDIEIEEDTEDGNIEVKINTDDGVKTVRTIKIDGKSKKVSTNDDKDAEVIVKDYEKDSIEVKTIVKSKAIVIDGDDINLHNMHSGDDSDDMDVDIEFFDVGDDGEKIMIKISDDGKVSKEISVPMSMEIDAGDGSEGSITVKINDNGDVIEKNIKIDAEKDIE